MKDRIPDFKIFKFNIGEPGWKRRIHIQAAVWSIRLKTEDRLKQMKDTSGRPSLRNIGPFVLNGKASRLAGETSVELRKAVIMKVAGCLKNIAGNTVCFLVETVPLKTHSDDPVVMWPNRSQLILERIEGRILAV